MGPSRDNNEDYLAFFQPEEEDNAEEGRPRFSAAILADGVGGHARGEVASRMAVETALKLFQESKQEKSANQLIWNMFTSANQAVYDAGVQSGEKDRMATTLTVAIFGSDEISIGHVGDSRAYLIQQGQIRRVTTDHSYVAMQMKGRAALRTGGDGQPVAVLTDAKRRPRSHNSGGLCHSEGNLVMTLSSDHELYSHVTEREILEIVTNAPPADACQKLIAVAEERKTDDNLSVQVAQIEEVERVNHGNPDYRKATEVSMDYEMGIGQVLDERFQITDVINRSGMATIFKAIDLNTGQRNQKH